MGKVWERFAQGSDRRRAFDHAVWVTPSRFEVLRHAKEPAIQCGRLLPCLVFPLGKELRVTLPLYEYGHDNVDVVLRVLGSEHARA